MDNAAGFAVITGTAEAPVDPAGVSVCAGSDDFAGTGVSVISGALVISGCFVGTDVLAALSGVRVGIEEGTLVGAGLPAGVGVCVGASVGVGSNA